MRAEHGDRAAAVGGVLSVLDQRVGVDLLHVVEVFQRVEQLLHLDRVVAGEHGFGGRLHDDLGELGLEVRGGQGKDGRYFEVAGVPADLAKRWSARTEDIERAARTFRQRYGREPRAGELGAMTVATRGTKTVLRTPPASRM